MYTVQENFSNVPTPLNKQIPDGSCYTEEGKEECEEESIFINSAAIQLDPTPPKAPLYQKFLQGSEVHMYMYSVMQTALEMCVHNTCMTSYNWQLYSIHCYCMHIVSHIYSS